MCVTAFHVYLYILHFVTSRIFKYILCFIFAPSYSSCSTFLNIIYIYIYIMYIYNKSVLSHLFAAQFLKPLASNPSCVLTEKKVTVKVLSYISFRPSLARHPTPAWCCEFRQLVCGTFSNTVSTYKQILFQRNSSWDVNDAKRFLPSQGWELTTLLTHAGRAPLIGAGCFFAKRTATACPLVEHSEERTTEL